MELKNKTVAVLGDSITQGTGASKQENRFVNVFSEITQSKTINYGIGGTSIAPHHTPLWGQLHRLGKQKMLNLLLFADHVMCFSRSL